MTTEPGGTVIRVLPSGRIQIRQADGTITTHTLTVTTTGTVTTN